jgi:hypothetical protein
MYQCPDRPLPHSECYSWECSYLEGQAHPQCVDSVLGTRGYDGSAPIPAREVFGPESSLVCVGCHDLVREIYLYTQRRIRAAESDTQWLQTPFCNTHEQDYGLKIVGRNATTTAVVESVACRFCTV